MLTVRAHPVHLRRVVCLLPIITTMAAMALGGSPLDKFGKLEAEMNEAALAYELDASKAPGGHEAAQDADHATDRPAAGSPNSDPRLAVLKKMDDFVGEVAGRSDAGYIETQIFLWAIDLTPKSVFPRFQRLAKRYANDSSLEEAIAYTPFAYFGSATPTEWVEALKSLSEETKRKPTRIAALLASGVINKETGEVAAARKNFARVLELGPQSAHADGAKLYIRDIDHLQVGMKAPEFVTTTLDGRKISLASLRGKVVLLDVWATWCPPCVAEIPHLKKIAKEFAQQPFEIVAVSVDDERDSVARLVKALGAPGIQTWDEKGAENPVANLYAVQQYPTWFLIDQEGVIRARDPFGDKLAPAVRSLLGLAKPAGDAGTHP